MSGLVGVVEETKRVIWGRFDGAKWAWLDSNRLLFSLRYGQVGLLDLHSMDFKLYGLTGW